LNAKGDILFHVSPRFGEKEIVMNSKIDGAWGKEEKHKAFPFKSDTIFDIMVVNEEHSYQIFINGEHYCAFAHIVQPPTVNSLQVEGDIELFGVNFK